MCSTGVTYGVPCGLTKEDGFGWTREIIRGRTSQLESPSIASSTAQERSAGHSQKIQKRSGICGKINLVDGFFSRY